MLQLEVEDIQPFTERRRHAAPGMVVVGLDIEVAARGKRAIPACGQVDPRAGDATEREIDAADRDRAGRRLLRGTVVGIALHGEAVRGKVPIGAKTHLGPVAGIVDPGPVRGPAVEPARMLAIHPVVAVRAQRGAVAEGGVGAVVAHCGRQQRAMAVPGRSGDDVDDAIDRIHPPQRAARAADHLDALDILQHHVLRVPEHAGKQRRIDRAAVDQDQQLVRRAVVAAVHAARRNGMAHGAGLGHLQVGRQAQRIGKVARTGAMNVIGSNDEDGRCSVRQTLGPPGHRRDLDVAQLLQRQRGQVLRRRQIGQRGVRR